jgi:basic amino acid/polyamine antiporter, APA family
VLLGSFCYAELGATMPEAGGEYVYLSRGLGSVWGFLYGWTSAMIMKPGSAAIISAGLLRFAGFLLPSVTKPLFTWHFWVPVPIAAIPIHFHCRAAVGSSGHRGGYRD